MGLPFLYRLTGSLSSPQLNDDIGLLAADLMITELRRILGDPSTTSLTTPPPENSSTHLQAAAEARALEQVLLFDADNQGQGQSQVGLTVLTVSPTVTMTSNAETKQSSQPESQVPLEEVGELNELELDEELSIATSAAIAVRQRQGESSQGDGAELLSLNEEDEEDFIVVVSSSEPEVGNDVNRLAGNCDFLLDNCWLYFFQ